MSEDNTISTTADIIAACKEIESTLDFLRATSIHCAWQRLEKIEAENERLRAALQDSRLLWSMTCKCGCDGCKALDKRLINLAEQSPGSAGATNAND